jgi:spore germination protein
MKLAAAAVVALLVAIGLAGCGGSAVGPVRAETITINLAAASSGSALSASGSSPTAAGTTPTAVGPAANAVVAPLAPAADARLNGVSVWVPYWSLATSVATAIDNVATVRVAHPFIDEITQSSTVVDQSGGQAAAVSAELAARHLTVIPTVTETADMAAFTQTLADPRTQTALIGALLGIAEQPGNDGIDLDFEDMAIGTGNARQAARLAGLYPQFLARLCTALHRRSRSCEVTVMAKNTSGFTDPGGLDSSVYDYAALARVADRVQLMAYDDHVPSGAAGPIAPWPWVESVIDYALTQMPAAKVVLGIPAFGYDWSSRGGGTSLTGPGAQSLAASVHAGIGWSESDAEPYFRYRTGRPRHRVTHTVWFEDATAIYDRAVLAADDRLGGIALWAAGDEDPRTWTMLRALSR